MKVSIPKEKQKQELISHDGVMGNEIADREFLKFFLERDPDETIKSFCGRILYVIKMREGGVDKFAKKANLSKQTIYNSLTKDPNPTLKTLTAILDNLGLNIRIKLKDE